jgi:hypothetical protein
MRSTHLITSALATRHATMAVYIDQLRLMDAVAGDEITAIPLGDDFRTRFGNPYAVVHRGELHRVFLDACRAQERVTLANLVGSR